LSTISRSGAAVTLPGIIRHQHYSLDVAGAASTALADVFSFEGERAIGEPTKYVIQFTHPQHDLSRTEYLNRMTTFVIQPPQASRWATSAEPARRIQGVLTSFALLGSNRDQSIYEVVLESRLALLRNTPKCRFFLSKSIPEIIEQILRENGFDMLLARFELDLYRTYGKQAFIMQWEEDDLSFITRLCRRVGIWFVCEEGRRCEMVRFGDDFTHYRRDPAFAVTYRQPGGMASEVESVDTLEMRALTIPESYAVRAYNYEKAPAPVDGVKIIRKDRTTYGEAYTWGSPHLTADEAKREAELRQEAALAEQVVYSGTCNMLDLAPACVLKLSDRELADAKHGLLAVRVKCSASRKKPYRVEFTAIPSDRLYRLPLLEHTWPRVPGTVSGRVASTEGWRDPDIDLQGRYLVNLHLDRDSRTPGLQSCPMRLAKPFAGANQTGFHFGLVPDTEVTVAFHNGCPDFPYISQVMHSSDEPDPIVGSYPWDTRNTIRTRSNNTLEMEDRKGREHIKTATEHGKSQLNLGHTVDRQQKERGSGAELRTDLTAVVRGGGGLLLTAEAQTGAIGQQTDMKGAMEQFQLSQQQVQGLADAAKVAQAEIADLKGENQWLKNELACLRQAVIALSAPHGIGMSTPDRVMVAAGKDVSVAAQASFNVNALKNVALAAAGVVSVFAQRFGIKLLAGKGKVQIQALNDEMQLASEKDLSIQSANGRVVIEAKQELLLKCGGSYLRMTANGIEDGTRGDRKWKAAAFSRDGAASLPAELPVLPKPGATQCALRAGDSGMPFAKMEV
jgi:type VI secretion system secreted protein VgrG